MTLWDIKESKVVFLTGRPTQQQSHHEEKTVTSSCWACTNGSKVAIGYDSGDIYLWAIPDISNSSSLSNQNLPLQKLNLGYKLDKVPIISLRRVASDGKSGRLYINGFSEHAYLSQVETLKYSHTVVTTRTVRFKCIFYLWILLS
jgi:hypothetical protein